MRTLLLFALLGLPAAAADHRAALMEADRTFDRVTAEKGLDGWMSFFAAGARVNHRSGVIEGREALRKHYAGMFAQKSFSIRWKPLYAEASGDGTMGWTIGSAVISFEDEKGQKQSKDGRYLTVWSKQADGTWKVSTDLGN